MVELKVIPIRNTLPLRDLKHPEFSNPLLKREGFLPFVHTVEAKILREVSCIVY